jgi:hypothetical protein
VISIPDIQMANETKMALDEIKAGYWQLVNDELKPRLRQATIIDLSQRLGNMKTALSGKHKGGGMAIDLLVARQEASQLVSTKDALVADILLEGTASASGRLPVKQQAFEEARTAPLDKALAEDPPPRAARFLEDRP